MISNSNFMSNIDWFECILKDKDVVLCFTSALECLQMFLGYINETDIDVYAKEKGNCPNITYHIVDNYNHLQIQKVGSLYCTTFEQTVNDMLEHIDELDEQPLVEALNDYYNNNNKSFDGLNIRPENETKFENIKEWALEYYGG